MDGRNRVSRNHLILCHGALEELQRLPMTKLVAGAASGIETCIEELRRRLQDSAEGDVITLADVSRFWEGITEERYEAGELTSDERDTWLDALSLAGD